MTVTNLQALARRKGLTMHADALAFNLSDKNGDKLEIEGSNKLTEAQIEEFLSRLPDAPIKVSFTEVGGTYKA